MHRGQFLALKRVRAKISIMVRLWKKETDFTDTAHDNLVRVWATHTRTRLWVELQKPIRTPRALHTLTEVIRRGGDRVSRRLAAWPKDSEDAEEKRREWHWTVEAMADLVDNHLDHLCKTTESMTPK